MTFICRHEGPYPPQMLEGAVSIGNFDGVHAGHRSLLQALQCRAKSVRGPSIVLTFHPSPAELLYPGHVPPTLTWPERRIELLKQVGVDGIIVYPTNLNLLALTAPEFFQKIIVEQLQARAMVEGPNFRFGKNREGDVRFLKRVCMERSIQFEIVEPICGDHGEVISSSSIRSAIVNGEIENANRWLEQPYSIRGVVSRGVQRGRLIGFPTANLESVANLVPACGVYAGQTIVDDRLYSCAIHLGANPTFGETTSKIEVHLIDFDADLYGRTLEVTFLNRIRDVQTFDSRDSLIRQLHLDVEQARSTAVISR